MGDSWVSPGPHLTASLCLKYGFLLEDALQGSDDGKGQPIVGAQLLWALACRESLRGMNCKPRHEPAYDFGGHYANEPHQKLLLEEYGSDAAKSYGPWQVMLCNAPGFTPSELALDPAKAAVATVGYLKRYVLGAQKAKTLATIADTYNSGNWRDRVTPDVQDYISAVIEFYEREVLAAY